MSHMNERTGDYRYVRSETFSKMPFCIEMAGVDKCTSKYYLKRNNSPISVVGYTVSGCGIIKENGKEVKAEKGSLFIVTVGDSHEYHSLNNWEFYWVNIKGTYFKEILSKYGLEDTLVFNNFELYKDFINLIRDVTNNKAELYLWQIRMQEFLYKAALNLYKNREFSAKQTMGEKIKTEIEKHIGENLTEKEICGQLGISNRQAQRVFKKEFSISIHKFEVESKIRKAKTLLLNTNNSIKQIAWEIGFENEKYFSTFFRKNVGVSPTEYRALYS